MHAVDHDADSSIFDIDQGVISAFKTPLRGLSMPRDQQGGVGKARQDKRVRYSKNGGVAGISTYAEHDPIGVDWVLLMNGSTTRTGPKALGHATAEIRRAIHAVEHWPDRDLFDRYLPAGR